MKNTQDDQRGDSFAALPGSANLTPRTDEDHHAIMNGPRIAQSLPKEYLEALLKAASSAESSPNAEGLPSAGGETQPIQKGN